ncbi:MAG TPA: hypothetical protein VGI39_27525 [Polyangiaceae bacterium]
MAFPVGFAEVFFGGGVAAATVLGRAPPSVAGGAAVDAVEGAVFPCALGSAAPALAPSAKHAAISIPGRTARLAHISAPRTIADRFALRTETVKFARAVPAILS